MDPRARLLHALDAHIDAVIAAADLWDQARSNPLLQTRGTVMYDAFVDSNGLIRMDLGRPSMERCTPPSCLTITAHQRTIFLAQQAALERTLPPTIDRMRATMDVLAEELARTPVFQKLAPTARLTRRDPVKGYGELSLRMDITTAHTRAPTLQRPAAPIPLTNRGAIHRAVLAAGFSDGFGTGPTWWLFPRGREDLHFEVEAPTPEEAMEWVGLREDNAVFWQDPTYTVCQLHGRIGAAAAQDRGHDSLHPPRRNGRPSS